MTGYYGGFCAALTLVGQFIVSTNVVKAVTIRFVSVSNTETECRVHYYRSSPLMNTNTKNVHIFLVTRTAVQ